MDGLKRQNGILLGVCGGIAARYNISPLVVRLVFLFSGVGIVPYIILAILMPKA